MLLARDASAQDATKVNANFLFVQTANSMAFDSVQNQLTLHYISPTTLSLSDRPERIAGNMTTESDNGTLRQTVAVLDDPVLENGNLRYIVRIGAIGLAAFLGTESRISDVTSRAVERFWANADTQLLLVRERRRHLCRQLMPPKHRRRNQPLPYLVQRHPPSEVVAA